MIDWPVLFRDVGLGFKAPREAKETNYIDKKCPFTGNISIRGKILNGVIQKMKMKRTIVIRRDYLHFVKKYSRCVIKHILFTWQLGLFTSSTKSFWIAVPIVMFSKVEWLF